MVKQIESLGRGLRVLGILEGGGAYSLTDLAQRTELPKSTLLRMLETLRTGGFARRRRTDGHWQASLSRFNGGDPRSDILADTVAPVLDELCGKIAWPSDVGIYDKGGIRVLESSRRLSPFVVNRDVVARHIHVLPSAMGRAILAWSSPARLDEILAELSHNSARPESMARDRAAVQALIDETRARGYATRQYGYFVTAPSEAKVMAMAVPVMVFGEPIAAINVVWIGTAMSEEDFARLHLSRLRDAASSIAVKMGDGTR
ncbi:helix-turn-helix domain-containing protein [Pararhodobacter zhoushanensis]|uniref:Helix-turn-helix domain-containing protein n=1 Tax=Pararhodobacter zhoushanensis TaxID=2479545 RepID=A0ABT3GV77_9RHOB|nr:IclR family transcriptional regulator C-terminal domain-containing protein [Pararhodobacter zhoushanensis]MCW1931444.1 helix-turn-helix domain-containing protein [Pararhodobacter zhoushanensis]